MSYAQTEQAVYRYGPQVNIPDNAGVARNAGDVVVIGTFCGIALEPIAANNDPGGSLCIQGVFQVLKETGAAINLGDELLWDSTNKVCYVTGGGYSDSASLGKCVLAAASGDATVLVYVNPFGHTAAG